MTGSLPGLVSDTEHEEDLRGREDDPTPRGVVRAVVERLVSHTLHSWKIRRDKSPITVLDVCAGSGVWSSEVRRLALAMGVPVEITAVELDERKHEHLDKWADRVIIDDLADLADIDDYTEIGDSFDLAIGNPHFSGLVTENPDLSMPAQLLRVARRVMLLHQEQSLQKSRAGARVWAKYPPSSVLHIPGSIRFRSGTNPKSGKPYGADSRCYQVTTWRRGHTGPAACTMLPWLPSEARRWRVVPGTEEPSEDLPARPGWQP